MRHSIPIPALRRRQDWPKSTRPKRPRPCAASWPMTRSTPISAPKQRQDWPRSTRPRPGRPSPALPRGRREDRGHRKRRGRPRLRDVGDRPMTGVASMFRASPLAELVRNWHAPVVCIQTAATNRCRHGWPLFGRTRTLNIATYCVPVSSPFASSALKWSGSGCV